MGRLLAVVIFLIVLRVNQSNCLKCYSCGEPSTPQHTSSNVMSCREFDEATDERALERFIIECPSEYVSCTTQKQGNQVSRNCDTLQMDDCQVANGVTYCFCTHDLCNWRMSTMTPPPMPAPHHHEATDLDHTIDLSDDEDYSEMSGNGSDGDHIKEASEEIAVEAPFNGINNETRASSTNAPAKEDPGKHYVSTNSSCQRHIVSGFGLVVVLLHELLAAVLL